MTDVERLTCEMNSGEKSRGCWESLKITLSEVTDAATRVASMVRAKRRNKDEASR